MGAAAEVEALAQVDPQKSPRVAIEVGASSNPDVGNPPEGTGGALKGGRTQDRGTIAPDRVTPACGWTGAIEGSCESLVPPTGIGGRYRGAPRHRQGCRGHQETDADGPQRHGIRQEEWMGHEVRR